MPPTQDPPEFGLISAKFVALKRIVHTHPELVEFLEFNEANFRAVVTRFGPKKVIIRGIHKEIESWVRELFRGDERQAALDVLRKLDDEKNDPKPSCLDS